MQVSLLDSCTPSASVQRQKKKMKYCRHYVYMFFLHKICRRRNGASWRSNILVTSWVKQWPTVESTTVSLPSEQSGLAGPVSWSKIWDFISRSRLVCQFYHSHVSHFEIYPSSQFSTACVSDSISWQFLVYSTHLFEILWVHSGSARWCNFWYPYFI